MKLKPLKIHFYSYKLVFLLFYLIQILLFNLFFILKLFDLNQSFLIVLLITFVFSIFIGSYEYSIISNSYLSLKTNRKEFFINSVVFQIISSLLLLLSLTIIGLISHLIFKEKVFDYLNIKSFIPLLLSLTLLHFMGNFLSLILFKIKFLKTFIILIILISLILNGNEIYKLVNNSITWIIDSKNIYYVISTSIIGAIIINLINYYKFTVKY